MRTDIFLQQLAQRMDGDRKAISQAQAILRSMIDRKLWKQMESAVELPKDIEQIETLLEQHNIFFRRITLSDRWWARCTGYMMGFMADDNTPVILKPGFTDYTFIHPKTNQAMTASRHADLLKQEALITCLPLTEDNLTVKSILRYAAYSLSKYDLLYILMAGIGVALLTMFTPYVSKLIFSEVIPSGDANQIVPIAVLLFSAAVGLTMVYIARNLVVVRIKDKVEYALQTALMSRLLQMPTTFTKRFTPGDLSNRLLSLSRVSSNLTANFPVNAPDLPVLVRHGRTVLHLWRTATLHWHHRRPDTDRSPHTGEPLYTKSAAQCERQRITAHRYAVCLVFRHPEDQDHGSGVPCLPSVGKGIRPHRGI